MRRRDRVWDVGRSCIPWDLSSYDFAAALEDYGSDLGFLYRQMIPGSNVSRTLARTGVDWVLVDCKFSLPG